LSAQLGWCGRLCRFSPQQLVFSAVSSSHEGVVNAASPASPDSSSLADEMPGAITWSWNVATGEVSWGEGIEGTLFGLPEGGFGGTFEAYLGLVHPDDRAYFHAVIERTLSGADEYVMSHRVMWPDGSTHWIDGRGRLSRDAEGRFVNLLVNACDALRDETADTNEIHISTYETNERVFVEVRDNGTGIAPEIRGRISTRSSPPSRSGEGQGSASRSRTESCPRSAVR
jgi:PAS domain-containing protein